ncbi:class I lanthipeptide [Chitinophaga solisilvae]|uniref:class I lanthipeptide n=1 Tax=Chitinophaga solisilvae TaxID=1233460 RepID=UPI00136877D2|nr:class I lanthipeptide [Chitinophaga solisilvae]
MKKKVALDKKLSFSKQTIASLTVSNQQRIAGGKGPVTLLPECSGDTWQETCITSPGPDYPCKFC